MHLGVKKKKENKVSSEDPNVLRRVIDEIRQETGLSPSKLPPGRFNQGKLPSFLNPNLLGGDNNIIDGPEDYAFNKLHLREESNEEDSYLSQGHQPYSDYRGFDKEMLNYPFNAVYDNFHIDQTNQYQENYSYQGYYQPSHQKAQGKLGGYPSGKESWYSYDSFQSVGHPYYQGNPEKQGYTHGGYHHKQPANQYHGTYNVKLRPRDLDPSWQDPGYKITPPPNLPPMEAIDSFKNDYQSDNSSSEEENGALSDSNKQGGKEGGSKTKNQLKRFKQLIEAKPSNVLHVKGLESEHMTCELINSLFDNFGNIVKLLFVKHKHAAFIVYDCQDLAIIAKEMLTNLRFMDCHMKVGPPHQITFSNEMTFDKILSKESQNQLLIPNPKFYRFKDKKISINPPSKILHLSNIAREVYNETAISEIFKDYCTVKKIKLLNKKADDKCMALVELACLEDALVCIAVLHNRIIFSR